MGREIFDKLYKTLTEKYAKDNELLKYKIQDFLSNQSEIRMYVEDSPNFGHQSSTLHVMRRLIDMGFVKGTISIVCANINVVNTLSYLLPKIQNNKEQQSFSLDGHPQIKIEVLTIDNLNCRSDILLGITGGFDNNDYEALQNPPLTLKVKHFIVLQPYRWDYLLPDSGYSQIQWSEDDSKSLIPPLKYVNLVENIKGFIDKAYYYKRQGDNFPEKQDEWDENQYKVLEKIVSDSAVSICVTYGMNGKNNLPAFSLDMLINISAIIMESNLSKEKKNIVISFSDIDKSVYTALKQKLDGQTDNPFGIYCKSKNLKCKIEYIIKPDVQEFNSKLKSIQAGNVLIVEIGTVPQPLFNYVFCKSTFPPVFEGQGTANLALSSEYPFLQMARTTTRERITSVYPSFGMCASSSPYKNKYFDAIIMQQIANNICINVSSNEWQAYKLQRVANFINKVHDESSIYYNYFKEIIEYYTNEANDKLISALNFYLANPNKFTVPKKSTELLLNHSTEIESLYMKICRYIQDGSIELTTVDLGLNAIPSFYKDWMGYFLIKQAYAELSDDKGMVALTGVSDCFGEDNTGVRLEFTAPNEHILSKLTATLNGDSIPLEGVDWFQLEHPEIEVIVGEDLYPPVSGRISGIVPIGADLKLTIELPLTGGQWVLKGDFQKERIGIAYFTQLVGGVNLADNLPQPFRTFADLGVQSIDIAYDTDCKSIDFIVMDICTSPSDKWQLLPGLQVSDIGLTCTVSNPGGKDRTASYLIHGNFSIGKESQNKLSVEAAVPDFHATVSLVEGTISTGDLFTLFWSDASLDLKSEIPYFLMDIDPSNENYNLQCGIESDWTFFTLPNPKVAFTMTGVAVSVCGQQGHTSGKISGSLHIGEKSEDGNKGVDINLVAGYAQQTWSIEGGTGKDQKISLIDIAYTFLKPFGVGNIPQWVSNSGMALEVKNLYFKAGLPDRDTGKENSYVVAGEAEWNLNHAGFSLALAAAVDIRFGGQQVTGKVVGDIDLLGLDFEIGYLFGEKDTELYLQWEGIRAECKPDAQQYILNVEDMSLGILLSKLMSSIITDFELPAPWNFLNDISLKNFQLVIDKKNEQLTLAYEIGLDLGFIKISKINLTKDNTGVYLGFDGSFLGMKIKDGNESTQALAGKGSNVQDMPTVPGEGEAFDLRLFVMGQHVTPAGKKDFTSVEDAINALELAFTDPNDTPDAIPIGTSGTGMIFSPESNWLTGADFTVAKFYRVALVFNDPDLYGLSVTVSDHAQCLKNLQFSVLYKKINDTTGVYQTVVQLPDRLRYLKLGAVSLTLPNFGIQVYTNGDFYFDFGWPDSIADFSRCFTLQIAPYVGSGGFYFASLSSETATNLPAVSHGTFSPVIEAGIALSFGIGKSIDGGIFKAELYLTIVGMLEGTYAVFNTAKGLPAYSGMTDTYYRFAGTLSLVGKISCEINLAIISASLETTAYVLVSIVFEAYKAVPLYFEAGLSVKLSVKINLGLFKIRLKLSFSVRISASLTLGSDNMEDSLWYKVDHLDGLNNGIDRLLPLQEKFCPIWKPIFADGETYNLLLHFVPQLTTTDTSDASKDKGVCKCPLYVGMLYLDHQEDDSTGHFGIQALALGCFYWAMGAILESKNESKRLTLAWLREQEVTIEEIKRLTEYMGQGETDIPFRYEDENGNDVRNFMKTFFHIHISSPDRRQEEEHDASVFPMIPDLVLTKTLNGSAESICFRDGPFLVDSDYIRKVHDLFNTLKATAPGNMEQSARNISADQHGVNVSDGQSLSSFVFADYVALVVKQVLQTALEYMSSQELTTMNVEELAQHAIKGGDASQGKASEIGAMASRFLLHGLRLPVPPGDSPADTSPLYALTGQQWEIPMRHGEDQYEYSVSLRRKDEEREWIAIGLNGDGLLIDINNELIDRNEQIADVLFEPSVMEGYPKAITNIKVIPQSFSMGKNTFWDYPGTLFDTETDGEKNTCLYVWKLPLAFKSLLEENQGRKMNFNIQTITHDSERINKGTIKRLRWATMVTMKVQSMAVSETASGLSANVYVLSGTDDASTHLLEALLRHIQLRGDASFIEQIRILMRTDPLSGKENWISRSDGNVKMAIVKTNMSTETHPEANVIMSMGNSCNTLNTTEEFLTFLWECSVVRSGGFYFYYQVKDSNEGLPAYLFDKEGMASVQILVTYKDFVPEIFLNGVVTGDDLDFTKTSIYLQSPDITMAVPVVPQGCIGYELLRIPTQEPDTSPASILPTEEEEKAYLENQYNLLGTLLPGLADYQNYLPASPLQPDDRNEEEDLWHYCTVIPYSKIKGMGSYEPAHPNPYIGIGDNVEMRLLWQDMFGNAMVGNQMTVSMPLLYTDTIIGLSQWPSASCMYLFRKDSKRQSSCLVLNFTFDCSRYEDGEAGRSNALADLSVYMNLLYQLQTDDISITILSTIEGTEEEKEGFKKSVDVNSLINGFITPVIDYLSGKSPIPPATFTLTETVEQELVASYCNVIPLCVRLAMKRDRNISPDFANSPGVASVSTVIQPSHSLDGGMLGFTIFAQEFEEAFANGDIQVKIATSSETLGEGKDIWMVRLDETGKNGIKITYNSANACYFSPRPLSTSLLSFSVLVYPYQNGETYPAGKETMKKYSSIDLDVWGRQFMEAVDDFLSPQKAVPAFLLDNGESLAEIINLKKQVANAVSGTVDYIVKPNQVENTCLMNANEKWRQEMLKELSSAYKLTAAVQIPVEVCSSWELPNIEQKQAINATPKFYGKMAADETGMGQNFKLSTSKLPLGNGKSWLTYMFECKDTSSSRNCKLDNMRFDITHLEQDIKGIGIGKYTSSLWLSFILPLDIKLRNTGGVTIPIPLRAYPIAPTVTSQKVVYKDSTDLQDALHWDFAFTYKNSTSAQDTIGVQLVLNTPGKDKDTLKKNGEPDLRQALAQFIESYPKISADFTTYLTGCDKGHIDKAKNAVNAFKEIMQDVCAAWKKWNQVDTTHASKRIQQSVVEPISLKYKVVEMENEYGSLCVEVISETGNALDVIPEIQITGYKTVEIANNKVGVRKFTYQDVTGMPLPYTNRNADPSRTAIVPDLNILDIQNAWGGVQIIRNEELIQDNHGEWLETNRHFLYKTPVTMFYAKQIPLLHNSEIIDLSKLTEETASIEKCIETMYDNLCESMKLLSVMSVKMEINYRYLIPNTNIQVAVPLFLTLPVCLNVKDKGSNFAKVLADKLSQKLIESGLPEGWLDFKLTVYSQLDEDIPILQLPFILKNANRENGRYSTP